MKETVDVPMLPPRERGHLSELFDPLSTLSMGAVDLAPTSSLCIVGTHSLLVGSALTGTAVGRRTEV